MKDREIILALFNPMTEHAKGCLVDDPHIKPRGPCICGFSAVAGAYLAAMREAKAIATAHYGAEPVKKSEHLFSPHPDLTDAASRCHCEQPHHLPVWRCPVHGDVAVDAL